MSSFCTKFDYDQQGVHDGTSTTTGSRAALACICSIYSIIKVDYLVGGRQYQ